MNEDNTNSAVVTGITGQDGAYLAKFLLDKGYRVHGTFRRGSSVNFWRIEELGVAQHPRLSLVEFDLTDPGSGIRLLEKARPREVYNLAAQSFVGVSFDQPVTTGLITGFGPVNLLEAIRTVDPTIAFLPGEHVGDVRARAGGAAGREHAVLSAQPVWGGEAVRTLDDRELPRVVRHLRRERHPLQPRVAAARARVRHAQDHRRRRPHRARQARRRSSSATSTRCATGATRPITSTACGGCCSTTSPTRSCSRRDRCNRCGASSSSRSQLPAPPSSGAARASTRPASMRARARSASASILRSTAPRKSSSCSATPTRRARSSGGAPRRRSRTLCRMMVEADLARIDRGVSF